MLTHTRTPREFSLDLKYTAEEGVIYLTGIQALVRVPIDQRRADRRAGLRTAGFISGYPGSPLGGFDFELMRQSQLLREHEIFFTPGLNEDLAATAVWGSQLATAFPGPKYDGVLGVWFGKAPGVDRSGDALRHANFIGTSRTGGVLAYAGDDPTCKSSTLPSATELADIATPTTFMFIAFRIPYSQAIGVKLIATPWTDANLRKVEGTTAKRLDREHRRKGMPDCLVEVLRLAALADVRMLVFDADAPVLDGLPVFDE